MVHHRQRFTATARDLEDVDLGSERILQITVGSEELHRFTLGLQLLTEKLVDSMVVSAPGKPTTVVFHKPSEALYAKVIRAHDRIDVTMGVELSACLFFYLRYVRDGVAEVSHIDLHTEDGRHGLTFAAVDVAPPGSPADLDRLLATRDNGRPRARGHRRRPPR